MRQAAQNEPWATYETGRAKRLQTNTIARLQDNTVEGNEGHQHIRERAPGRDQGSGSRESGRTAWGQHAE